jgi:hypothetical protein
MQSPAPQKLTKKKKQRQKRKRLQLIPQKYKGALEITINNYTLTNSIT